MFINIRFLVSVHWEEIEYGTLGEWIGGVGTVLAFVGAFIIRGLDIHRQERTQRKDRIEIWINATSRAKVRAQDARDGCSTRFIGSFRSGSQMHPGNAEAYKARVDVANEAIVQLDLVAVEAPSPIVSDLIGDIARKLGQLVFGTACAINMGTLGRGNGPREPEAIDIELEEQFAVIQAQALEAERELVPLFERLERYLREIAELNS